MRVPLINLERLHAPLRGAIDTAIAEVLDSSRFIGGDVVEAFEERFAACVGARHAIAVSSGTDALLASLMALDVGPGDEVLTTPFTFASPAQSIARLGATPVFVDIDAETFALDPGRLDAALTHRTVGIVPVHIYGGPAPLEAIAKFADRYGLWVVEDAAQAVGTRVGDRFAGTLGTAGCFSFFPTKTLGAAGDGGMVTTDDDAFAAELRRVCHHGAEPKYVHHRIGGNFRLDAIQAAILDVKLDALDGWLKRRAENARIYHQALPADVRPTPLSGHSWHQYVIRHPRRDTIATRLREAGIDSAVYYPQTLDRQPCFEDSARVCGSLDVAHAATNEVLAVPVGAELSDDERDYVATTLRAAIDGLPEGAG